MPVPTTLPHERGYAPLPGVGPQRDERLEVVPVPLAALRRRLRLSQHVTAFAIGSASALLGLLLGVPFVLAVVLGGAAISVVVGTTAALSFATDRAPLVDDVRQLALVTVETTVTISLGYLVGTLVALS